MQIGILRQSYQPVNNHRELLLLTSLYPAMPSVSIMVDSAALAHPRRLPRPLTPLVGRERDLASVIDLLRQDFVQLLTLTGPGGVGKTRLAFAVAQALVPELAGGTHFVAFASVLDPALVPSTVVRTLGLPDLRGQDPLDQVATALGDRPMLLVLDNLEHLLAAAPWVAGLLGACPHLTLLVTSRERLRIGSMANTATAVAVLAAYIEFM